MNCLFLFTLRSFQLSGWFWFLLKPETCVRYHYNPLELIFICFSWGSLTLLWKGKEAMVSWLPAPDRSPCFPHDLGWQLRGVSSLLVDGLGVPSPRKTPLISLSLEGVEVAHYGSPFDFHWHHGACGLVGDKWLEQWSEPQVSTRPPMAPPSRGEESHFTVPIRNASLGFPHGIPCRGEGGPQYHPAGTKIPPTLNFSGTPRQRWLHTLITACQKHKSRYTTWSLLHRWEWSHFFSVVFH